MIMQDQAGIALIAALSMTVAFGAVLSHDTTTSNEQSRNYYSVRSIAQLTFAVSMFTSGLFSTLGVLSSTFKYLRLNVTTDERVFDFLHMIEKGSDAWMHNAWVWTRYGLNSLCFSVSLGIFLGYGLVGFVLCLTLACGYLYVTARMLDRLEKGWQAATTSSGEQLGPHEA